jgi:hypothetical protein
VSNPDDWSIDDLLAERRRMLLDRVGREPVWAQIDALLYPSGTPAWGNVAPGASVRQEIYDNTAEDAADLAAAGLHAMIDNSAMRFFEMGMFDDQYARDSIGGQWLYKSTSLMLAICRSTFSRYDIAAHEYWIEAVTKGTGIGHWEERPGFLPLRRAIPCAQCAIAEGDDGNVDMLAREFPMTPRTMKAKWGADALPEEVAKMAEDSVRQHDEVKVIHMNYPRHKRDSRLRDRWNMAYRSVYLCEQFKGIIEDGGSHEFEYDVSRWPKRAGELWGRGPGDKALADIDALQRMVRSVMLAGERTVDPPILVPDQGMTGGFSFRSRAMNAIRAEYLSNGAHPKPFLGELRVDIGLELIQDKRTLIRRAFLQSLLELIRDPRATATQFLGVQEEQMRGLAPILGRLTAEGLGRSVGRLYNICKRIPGFFDPVPPDIAGRPLQPTFETPAARALRAAAARAIVQGFEALGPMMQADPSLEDNFDKDQAARTVGAGVGFPATVLRPIDQRDRMRAARQQVTQESTMAEQGKDITTMAKNIAPFLKAIKELGPGGDQPAPARQAA